MELISKKIVADQISNAEISKIGVEEKYIRKDHYNTIKVWWARRPLLAMRALIINDLLQKNDTPREIQPDIIYHLNPDKEILIDFKNQFNCDNYSVLDVFAGGGSIPFEAARLGCKTFSSELNPVASLLQETIFKSLPIQDYPKKLKKAGHSVIARCKERLSFLYTFENITPYVIFWGKYMKCKSCGSEVNLTRLKYLAKKKNKLIVYDKNKREVSNLTDATDKEIEDSGFICSNENCKQNHKFSDVKDYCESNKLYFKPLVFCFNGTSSKQYKAVTSELQEKFDIIERRVDSLLSDLQYLLPKENVIRKNGVINPTIYDLKQPQDFFSRRQLVVLLTVIEEIINEYKILKETYDEKTVKQIVLGLTSLIEFLVDWNSVSNMWICQNEQTGRSLAGPGVGMKWDFIEVNPFYASGSNLLSKIERVCSTFNSISINNDVQIFNGSSASLPLQDKTIDLVLTDPPYFDSVDYTGLSDFFRPWFEAVIKNTFNPNVNLKNDTSSEAIVDLTKSGKKKRDSSHYKEIMTSVLKEANRVLKSDGKVLLLYSHKTIEGWQVIAETFKDAKLYINNCIPLDMERSARPRAMTSQALNGVIVFELMKSKEQIRNIEDDLAELESQIENNDVLESNIIIHLAGLACKYYTLSDLQFDVCYEHVKQKFSEIRNNYNQNIVLDNISDVYLNSLLNNDNENLSQDEIALLKKNGLINEKGELKKIVDVIPDCIKDKKSTLYHALVLFQKYKGNSTQSIFLKTSEKYKIKKFFSTISGVNLNTLRKRSSDEDIKVSRIILSKIQ